MDDAEAKEQLRCPTTGHGYARGSDTVETFVARSRHSADFAWPGQPAALKSHVVEAFQLLEAVAHACLDMLAEGVQARVRASERALPRPRRRDDPMYTTELLTGAHTRPYGCRNASGVKFSAKDPLNSAFLDGACCTAPTPSAALRTTLNAPETPSHQLAVHADSCAALCRRTSE